MIVDASAILAMLLKEPEEHAFADIIGEYTDDIAISPVNHLEIALSVDRGRTPELSEALNPLLLRLGVKIAPVSAEQARLAREANQRFGKGNHAAKLNLGDCFADALAKARDELLLFKGDDFRLTDVEAAL